MLQHRKLPPPKNLPYRQEFSFGRRNRSEKSLVWPLRSHRTQDKDNEKTFRLKPEVKNDIDLEDYKPSEVLGALYSAVSGSGNDEYSRKVIAEAMAAFNSNPNPKLDEISNAFHGAMLGMAPRDIVESQLCSRLLILNSRANHYMSLATTAEYQNSL